MSRHSPLSPEAVNTILNSPESNSELGRQFGVSKQTISKIRMGEIHRNAVGAYMLTDEQKAVAVRAVLEHSPVESHLAVAESLGIARDTVMRIRFGQLYADVLPELERLDPSKKGAYCYRCTHWGKKRVGGDCTLGIPEAAIEGSLYARGCGAYQTHSQL